MPDHRHKNRSARNVESSGSEPIAREQPIDQDRGNAAAQEELAFLWFGTNSDIPSTKKKALKRQEKGVKQVRKVVKKGLAKTVDPDAGIDSHDNLFHNAAEWVDQNEADVVVLSPTHDSAQRTQSSSQVAHFDHSVNWDSGTPDYDEGNLSETTHVTIKNKGTAGSMSIDGETLSFVDPVALPNQTLIDTLVHEVQHDADQHGGVWADAPMSTGGAPTWAYNSYATEFRAYWFGTPEGSKNDRFPSSGGTNVTNIVLSAVIKDGSTKTASTAFNNERQEAIFKHLTHPLRSAGDWYDFTNDAWSQSYAYVGLYYASDPDFKAFVDGLARPTSGNAIGSVRIQTLSDAFASGGREGISMSLVQWAVRRLDELDLAFLSDRTLSGPFWDQAESSLSDEEFLDFEMWVVEACSA